MRRAAATFAVTAAMLGTIGCGDSAQDRAQNKVCDARADIQKQIDDLKGLTASTVTADAVSSSLSAIRDDLGKIKDAQDELSDDRRSELKTANEAFTASVGDVVSNVLSSKSLNDAKSQLQAAVGTLVDSYQQTLAPYDCG